MLIDKSTLKHTSTVKCLSMNNKDSNFVNIASFLRAVNVGSEYGYEVTFTGVGQAPPGQQERVGFCSQIGVFHRLSGTEACNKWFGDDAEDVFSYTLVS